MKGRKKRGGSLIEVAVAAIFLIPIVLGILDAITMVMANMDNDALAKNAARAAANQPDKTNAYSAAQRVITDFKLSQTVTNVTISDFNYTDSHDEVLVATTMTVALPVQIASFQNVTFTAQSIQPIVSEPLQQGS